MKVAMFCSARNSTYGAVQSLISLSVRLKSMGHEVHMITFSGRGFGAEAQMLGFEVKEVKVRLKVDPIAVLALAKLLKQEGYHVIHSHLSTSSLIGGLAGRVAKVPSVATVHGLSHKGSFITNDLMIAVSHAVKDHLVGQGVRPDKIRVVHNGIADNSLNPDRHDAARQALGLASSDFAIGSTIRLTKNKGAHHAINAFRLVAARHPKSRLVLFGDGEDRENLKDLSTSLGLQDRIQFAGYRPDVRDLLAGLDIFVFPSLKEALGIAVIEAQMEGLPVVAHDVGGLSEVVTKETGILVPAGDEDAMAGALCDLLENVDRRLKMGQSARARAVTEFGIDSMAERTLKVYREIGRA